MLINMVLMVASGMHSNSTVYVPTTPAVTNSPTLTLTDDPYPADFPVSGDTPPQMADGQGGGMGSEGGNPFES